jgi:DNA-binding IclR family transcriptional regulator
VSEGLPREVRAFIAAYINSLEQLEVLLALRADARRAWTASELSDHLRLAPDSVATRLSSLHRFGLLAEEGGRFRFGPASADLEVAAAAVARAYDERRFTVVNEIFSRPNDVVTLFANAFKIRRDDE